MEHAAGAALWDVLPDELLLVVGRHLAESVRDLQSLAATCKRLHDLIRLESGLWRDCVAHLAPKLQALLPDLCPEYAQALGRAMVTQAPEESQEGYHEPMVRLVKKKKNARHEEELRCGSLLGVLAVGSCRDPVPRPDDLPAESARLSEVYTWHCNRGGIQPILPQGLRTFASWRECYRWHCREMLDTANEDRMYGLKRGFVPSLYSLLALCRQAIDVFKEEPNVLRLSGPLVVVANLQGQFIDLLQILAMHGEPPNINYLFLGDIISRGDHSILTMSLILAMKVRYPTRVHILRGNHETFACMVRYSMERECMQSYGNPVAFQLFLDVCNWLPLAAIINEKIFCVHGGLSPSIATVTALEQINRCSMAHDPDDVVVDLLWSRPEPDIEGWGLNERGWYTWGSDVTAAWCAEHGFDIIVLTEMIMEGYRWVHNNKVLSLYSAPNFAKRCGNLGSVLHIGDSGELEVYHLNPAFLYPWRVHGS